jgi:hypothetical protein
VSEELVKITEALKALMPPYCKFNNHTVDIKTSRSDTGQVFIAPVPVCIVEKNWREF